MRHAISGTTMPVLTIDLDPGELVVAEPGQAAWMTPNMGITTTTRTAGATSIWGALGRALAGGGLFMTEYEPQGGPGSIAFAARVPGSIHEIELPPSHGYLIHRHGFLCGSPGITLSIGFQRGLGAGLFGGDGFVLERLTGPGSAFVELGGECTVLDLAPGQGLRVHPGHVGMFQDTVAFDIELVPGIRNKLFGDGLFFARLTGPGRVWLQSLTMPGLAHALAPYLPGDGETAAAAGGGTIAGSLIKNFFDR